MPRSPGAPFHRGKCTVDGPSPSERRAVRRTSGDTIGPVQFREPPAGQALKAKVWDISLQGIGILADCDVATGTALAIHAWNLERRSPELTAHVRHTTRRPGGGWLLGCRFTRNLSMDDMLALG